MVRRAPSYRHSQSQSRIRLSCTGPIPVELLRWKFVEGRTVELKGNAGLELPSNIGELGDSVTKIDLSGHRLRGVARPIIPLPNGCSSLFLSLHTGELPLTIGQLKANGCQFYLHGNKGFTLSSDISAVMDATKLVFSGCDLSGAALPSRPHATSN